MVNNEKFVKRLNQLMNYYQLSATSFADSIAVGRSSISHILSGRNKPSLEFVMKIIEAFPEVELYWLLNGKGAFPKSNTPTPNQEVHYNKPSKNNDVPIANSATTSENDLFSETPIKDPIQTADQAPKIFAKSNTIARIVIFYTDGTFESYTK